MIRYDYIKHCTCYDWFILPHMFSPGKDTGPSPDLVSQMMEEALGQSDVSKEHFEE